MTNVIQFADKKRAIITAREVQLCLTVAGWDMWADRPKARPKVLETLLKHHKLVLAAPLGVVASGHL